jgi:hypothetical protein
LSYFSKPAPKPDPEPAAQPAAEPKAAKPAAKVAPENTAPEQAKPEEKPEEKPAVVDADAVGPAHLAPYQFQPGQSGNPQGRPKGSRNKLTEAFIADLFDDWRAHGKEAISATRQEKPAEYLKVVAGLAPKKIEVKEDPLDAFDDDELASALATIAALRQTRDPGDEDRREAPGPSGQKPH